MASGFEYGLNAAACDFDGKNRYIRITDIDEESHQYHGESPVSPQGILEAKYIVGENDILFARTGASTGKTYLYRKSDGLLYFAGFLIRATINERNDSNFVFNLTLTSKYNRWVKLTSMRSGQPGINSQEYASYRAYVPSLEEQQKISSFLSAIDKRIEKQRQLVEALKSYKRGVSTALFTRKLRLSKSYSSHNTEWSKKYLGDIFSERTERAAGSERLLAVTINNGVQDRTELDLKDNSSDDKRNYRVVHIGDLAYNTMRMWQGACGVSAFDGIVSPAYTVLYVTDNTDNFTPFWGYYFKDTPMLQTFQRNSQGLTSDTWNLKYEKFARISVYAPPFQEQVQIAGFLDCISDKIAANEDYLNTLVKYKRGLLSLLFI